VTEEVRCASRLLHSRWHKERRTATRLGWYGTTLHAAHVTNCQYIITGVN